MSLDTGLDDAQQAIADAVAKFCAERLPDDPTTASGLGAERLRELWEALAGLGVLALATPEGDGGARELVAALESLGEAAFPGPLAATFLATRVLEEPHRRRVAEGAWIVSLGRPPVLPFAPLADCFLVPEADGRRVRLGTPRGPVEPVSTLGGESWGRVDLATGEALAAGEDAWALHDTALAAQLAGAGRTLVQRAADHARTRRQFGRPIGDFQAVAHPLADAAMRLDAAGALARAAACAWDAGASDLRARAAAARLSAARAALAAAHTAHQTFGALGITLEGPVFHFSRRIRQLASQLPEDAAREALLADAGIALETP